MSTSLKKVIYTKLLFDLSRLIVIPIVVGEVSGQNRKVTKVL